MEVRPGVAIVASVLVFVVAALIGAATHLTFLATGSSTWLKVVLFGICAGLFWYLVRSLRRVRRKSPSTSKSKLQEMEEQWVNRDEPKEGATRTSSAPPPSPED